MNLDNVCAYDFSDEGEVDGINCPSSVICKEKAPKYDIGKSVAERKLIALLKEKFGKEITQAQAAAFFAKEDVGGWKAFKEMSLLKQAELLLKYFGPGAPPL